MEIKMSEYQLFALEKPEICCSDIEVLLGDYIDGELKHALHLRIDDHIKSCSTCQEQVTGYRLVVELAGEIGQERLQLPKEFHSRLKESLAQSLGLSTAK